LEFRQVIRRNRGFHGSAASLDLGQQYIHRPVQIEQQVGFGESGVQDGKKLLKKPKFRLVEVIFGK
jgi:hypothetical protein